MFRFTSCLVVLVVLVAPCDYVYAEAVQWPGNGHWYEVVSVAPGQISWTAAEAAAPSVLPGGYLATPTSAAENSFIFSLVEDDLSVWRLDGWDNLHGPWLGGYQVPGSPEPGGGWTWVSGEPWSYENWAPLEPNDYNGNEDSLYLFQRPWSTGPTWNDGSNNSLVRGYIVESLIPEPSTLALTAFGLLGLVFFSRRRKRGISGNRTNCRQHGFEKSVSHFGGKPMRTLPLCLFGMALVLTVGPRSSPAALRYLDRTEFVANYSGLTTEDFEELRVTGAVGDAFIGPLDSTTSRTGDVSPGDIVPGIQFSVPEGNGGIFLPHPSWFNTKAVSPNTWSSSLDIIFFDETTVVGFDLWLVRAGGTPSIRPVPGNLDVEIYGSSGMIGSTVVATGGTVDPEFLGFESFGEPITRINIDSPDDWVELVDNVAFGVPEPSTVALAAIGLAGLLGWGGRRKR